MTYRTAAIAAVLAAAAASTVAPAADRAPTPAATSATGNEIVGAKANSDKPRRYCIRPSTPGAGIVTGSIIPLSGCRTRAQWESVGVSLPND